MRFLVFIITQSLHGHTHIHKHTQTKHTKQTVIFYAPVVGEERSVSATLRLGEHVHLGLELLVSLHSAGGRQHLTTAHVLSLEAAQQDADVVTGLAKVHGLLEHLHTYKKIKGRNGVS